ncbi:hypothetical protein [Thioalkalivibrio sp. ARh3]|uniref:hypothetical protein n=1 Tax=Thioalkalivibrio sp. ARh3 TaxID=1158148 RepID=UPI0012DCA022
MSLYDDLGGGDALQAALDRFYEKVLADPPLATFSAVTTSSRSRADRNSSGQRRSGATRSTTATCGLRTRVCEIRGSTTSSLTGSWAISRIP